MVSVIRVLAYDGSSWVNVTSYVQSAELEEQGVYGVDTLEVSFTRDVLDTSTPAQKGLELRYEVDGAVRFGGVVDKPVSKWPLVECTAYSYGHEFIDEPVNESFLDTTPEDVFETLVSNYTSLTPVTPSASGVTIDAIRFTDQPLHEVLDTLSQLAERPYWTDYEKNAYFDDRQTESSNERLVVGSNVLEKPDWDYNPSPQVKRVIVQGGEQRFSITDSYTGDGSTTDYSLSEKPVGNVLVEVDGSRQEPEVDGATTGDYTVNEDEKSLSFNTAPPNGDSITASYEYAVPIRVEYQSASASDSRYTIKATNRSLTTRAAAREYARALLQSRGEGRVHATLLVAEEFPSGLECGKLVQVRDEDEGILDEDLVILKIRHSYRERLSWEIEVGSHRRNLADYDYDVEKRLRDLERLARSGDLQQIARSQYEEFQIEFESTQRSYTRNTYDTETSFGDGAAGDRGEGDTFEFYESTSADLDDKWDDFDGSGFSASTVSGGILELSGVGALEYHGLGGSSYELENGRIAWKFGDTWTAAGHLNIYFRYQDANNHYYLHFDYDLSPAVTNAVLYRVKGGVQTLVSGQNTADTDTWTGGEEGFIAFNEDYFQAYLESDNIPWDFAGTDSDPLLGSGRIIVENASGTHDLDYIKIYEANE